MLSFRSTVSALTQSILAEDCRAGDGAKQDIGVRRVISFVHDQHRRLPTHVRFPLTVLTLILDVSTVPRTLHPFHRLAHAERWRQILRWRNSSLGLRRQLIGFYTRLTVFGWFSEQRGRE